MIIELNQKQAETLSAILSCDYFRQRDISNNSGSITPRYMKSLGAALRRNLEITAVISKAERDDRLQWYILNFIIGIRKPRKQAVTRVTIKAWMKRNPEKFGSTGIDEILNDTLNSLISGSRIVSYLNRRKRYYQSPDSKIKSKPQCDFCVSDDRTSKRYIGRFNNAVICCPCISQMVDEVLRPDIYKDANL